MKRLRLVAVISTVLAVCLLVVSIVLWLQRSDYKTAFQLEKDANRALFANAGRMCSVTSSQEAGELLQTEVAVDAASFPAGFQPAVQDSSFLPLIDSCRYIGTKNNTRYINIVGQRYQNVEQAKQDFNTQRQRFFEAVALDAEQYEADEAFYYGGAIYIRVGERVLSYSLNKPEITASELQNFVEQQFDRIYQNALVLL